MNKPEDAGSGGSGGGEAVGGGSGGGGGGAIGGGAGGGESDGGALDAGLDAGTSGTRLFTRCTDSVECTFLNSLCRDDFPGGVCTRRCTQDATCNSPGSPPGVCANGSCFPACDYRPDQCNEWGASCGEVGGKSVCLPTCFPAGTTPPAGFQNSCAPARVCNPYQLVCAPNDLPAGPGEIGAPCTEAASCQSENCVPEIQNGMPSGFVGGFCLIAQARYGATPTLSRQNCPAGSVVMPMRFPDVAGQQGYCVPSCTRTGPADLRGTCRAGYDCIFRTLVDGGIVAGGCMRMDCREPANAALPNAGCPAGSSCVAEPAPSVSGRCHPN